jgi:hypothetical protein
MWAKHNCHARAARKQLTLENLEVRQLMAADLLATSSFRNPTPTPTSPIVAIRSFDGTGNNLFNFELGSTNEQLLRAAAAEYGDGILTLAGADRPSARVISNALAAQDEDAESNERKLTAYIYVWGQFLDHDIDLTEPPTTGKESANIAVPNGDPSFDPNSTNSQVIPFSRSRYDATTGTNTSNPREQINQITAWIDGSMIYGSDKATADSLRTFVGGKLKTSTGTTGVLPPTDASGNFLAGDVRANENIELTSMHALFVREHNRIAAQLARQNPSWTDEQIYQQARALVGAEIQVITYREFLPALLGQGALSAYRGYNAKVDPSIANEFSTAAFRLHTLINDDVEFFGNDGRANRDEVALADAFFNPDLLRETGIDGILKYSASTLAQEEDNQIVDGLRNFLFGAPGQGGLDLASLNIQRGRDHGLADYNSVREAYGLPRVTSFAETTSDTELQAILKSLYGTVDNIDLWVGALAEDHVPGTSVGQLTREIISDQFERLRDGDRFWYQRVFSGRTLAELEQTTLSDIIRRNTTVSNLQSNVFVLNSAISGQIYLDANRNGRQDWFESAVPSVEVQLLNDEGVVVDSTRTGRDGRYRFSRFDETGDYTVQIVLPSRMTANVTSREVLVSRGGLSIGGVNFALMVGSRLTSQVASTSPTTSTTATDAAIATMSDSSFTDSFGSLRTRMNRVRARGLA